MNREISLSCRSKHRGLWGFVFGVTAWAVGCASLNYSRSSVSVIDLIKKGQAAQAAGQIKEKAVTEGNSQVVYMFDYATALQLSEQYAESNSIFLKVSDLIEIEDYHSLTKITASLLLDQGMVQYKGEDYEKVLVDAMLAINFLMLGDRENAFVAARRLNEKLYKFKFEAKRNYEQNPFAFYLSGMIRESEKDWDNALINYQKAYAVNPGLAYLKKDLIRISRLARRPDLVQKYRTEFGEADDRWDPKMGEVVLIYQQGWGPTKRPHPAWHRVPKLYPVRSRTVSAKLFIEGSDKVEEAAQKVFSVEEVAIKTLDNAYAELVALRAAGLATKAVVADQIRQKNQLLGDLAWLGMNVMDMADLRQWSTLPESFQVARLRLAPGEYQLRAQGLDASGAPTDETSGAIPVKVQANQRTFINWRSVH